MKTDDIKIRIADWSTDSEALSDIRRQVFIEEQKVPEDMEWDGLDESSSHYIALLNGKTIGCARLKPDAQIGRMAVLSGYRGRGIGSGLLHLIFKDAAKKNMQTLYLHAQVDAIPFYEKHGFSVRGKTFFEANIPHREMYKKVC